MKQSLQLKQLQKLTPQQMQVIKLIEYPSGAFEDRIKQELDENPGLSSIEKEVMSDHDSQESFSEGTNLNVDKIEQRINNEDIPNYKLYARKSNTDNTYTPARANLRSTESFSDFLGRQILTQSFTVEEQMLVDFMIGLVDPQGYIRRTDDQISSDYLFASSHHLSTDIIGQIRHILMQVDNLGIGAFNLQDMLTFQAANHSSNSEAREIAHSILADYFEQLVKKHYSIIAKKLSISMESLRDAVHFIEKLNPSPGYLFADQPSTQINNNIRPDFTLTTDDGNVRAELNQTRIPQLKISDEFKSLLNVQAEKNSNLKDDKEALIYLKNKVESAKWFIEAVNQRQNTLAKTMNAIIHVQNDFFLSGEEKDLKPMILKDIADITAMDISTVSRVVNNKYVDTPYGLFLLKDFFSEGLQTEDGGTVSTIYIKKIIEDMIAEEDKNNPLKDDVITEKLKEFGVHISRRTTSKYREKLGIQPSRLRKKL